MPAQEREWAIMNRVRWRPRLSSSEVVCHRARENDRLTIRVEHGGKCVLAEMMIDEATALRRAEAVRRTLEGRTATRAATVVAYHGST